MPGTALSCFQPALLIVRILLQMAKYVTSRPVISGYASCSSTLVFRSNDSVLRRFADVDYFIGSPWVDWVQDKVPLFERLLPDMAAWAMQLYRGPIRFVQL